ncbi:MAG: hypothetical protein HY360_21425 [Verrucomicrobia bacterium]|nr:hypothetical protein [Verrucomicrobiota bacterium]
MTSTTPTSAPPLSLDELASEWIPTQTAAHYPAVHNFHEMLLLTEDLFRVNYWPGQALYRTWNPEFQYRTVDEAKLTIDRKIILAEAHQACAYEGRRRAQRGHLLMETATRMVFEENGVLRRLTLRNDGNVPCQHLIGFSLPGEAQSHEKGVVTCATQHDRRPDAIAYAVRTTFSSRSHASDPARGQPRPSSGSEGSPSSAIVSGGQGDADSPTLYGGDRKHNATYDPDLNRTMFNDTIVLQPGETRNVDIVLADAADAATARQKALAWLANFDRGYAESKSKWEARWANAFEDDPSHFSGCVPVLETDNEALRRIYYMSILTMVILFRTNMKLCKRFFITSGERDPGRVFLWDVSECATIVSLLEPVGTKELLRHLLRCDPHGGCVFNIHTGVQDGQWYAANDFSLFRLLYTYLAVTGDTPFLDESIAGLTVLQHLERLATNWKQLAHDDHPWLGDYGGIQNLLECVANYIHRVPSFNAANVWMHRKLAQLLVSRGESQRAQELLDEAERIKTAVLECYVPGEGVWTCIHKNGKRVIQRHCYDFAIVGYCLRDDLSPITRQEMIRFVHKELLTKNWMRAQSLQDVGATNSDRPDHGPYGAFAAWPAITAEALFLLGDPGSIGFLLSTVATTREGPYGQAHELVGPQRAGFEAEVRVASRVGCMRESFSGGSFAEIIVRSVFGFAPVPTQPLKLFDPKRDRGVFGTLHGLKVEGETMDIESRREGLLLALKEIQKGNHP